MRRVVTATLFGLLLVLGRTARAEEMRLPATDVPAPSEAAPPAEVAQARGEIDTKLRQMRAVSQRVRDDLRVTRRHGTRVQIACVDEALSRADSATRRARETGAEILAAYGQGDLLVARAARGRLGEIGESQRIAARDGAYCSAARPFVALSPTTVKVDVDPRIPRIP